MVHLVHCTSTSSITVHLLLLRQDCVCPPLAVATEKKKKIKTQTQINTIIIIQQKSKNISRTWGQEERGVVRGLAPLLWAWALLM